MCIHCKSHICKSLWIKASSKWLNVNDWQQRLFSGNPPKQFVVMEVASDGSSGDFLNPRLNLPLQFSSCDPWRFFCQSNPPPHGAWGQFTDRSSSRLIPYISCRFELLNYCPDCGNGYFQLFRYFLISLYPGLSSSTTFGRTSTLCSFVFPILMND